MTLSRRSRAVLAGSLTVLFGVLAGCGDAGADPESSSEPSTSGPPTSTTGSPPVPGDCGEVISPSVVAGLGWDAAVLAVEDRGGCLWSDDEGTIQVLGVGEEYATACRRLERVAPGGTWRPMMENPSGLEACGFVRPEEIGQSEVVVVDDADRVVSISVAALAPTSSERVTGALLALTGTTAGVP
ncbi:MAG TPA: hypothetical protein VNQ53_15575 [Nocardioides sp.]|nr:hypothetical protein [Nocardioides sp.]